MNKKIFQTVSNKCYTTVEWRIKKSFKFLAFSVKVLNLKSKINFCIVKSLRSLQNTL